MKNCLIILLIISSLTYGQFKEELDKKVDIRGGITNYNPSSMLLGFIKPENFSMSHSFSMSYTASGQYGMALGVYTNSMAYKFNDQLNLQVDASVVNSPYSSLGTQHSDAINGIYLSRAQINYQPSEDFFITFQYRNLPGGYYSPYYNRRPSLFNNSGLLNNYFDE